MGREQLIKKAAQFEFYIDLVLGLCVFVIALCIHSTLLHAQAISSFIGAAIAYVNVRHINQNQHEVDKGKIIINGRKEYFLNISLSIVLIYFGLAFFREGLRIEEEHHVDYLILSIIAIIAVTKFYVGKITIMEGKSLEATNLKIIGLITRNEAFIGMVNVLTLSGIFSEVPFISKISVIILAEIMILTGFRTISYYKKALIGSGLDENQEKVIYSMLSEIPYFEEVQDLIVHDYGYYNKFATVNAYMSENVTIHEIDRYFGAIKVNIHKEYGIELMLNILTKTRNND